MAQAQDCAWELWGQEEEVGVPPLPATGLPHWRESSEAHRHVHTRVFSLVVGVQVQSHTSKGAGSLIHRLGHLHRVGPSVGQDACAPDFSQSLIPAGGSWGQRWPELWGYMHI